MTLLHTICFIAVMCTSFTAALLCLFHSKIQKRYGLSPTALTYMTMSCVITGGIFCIIINEVLQ